MDTGLGEKLIFDDDFTARSCREAGARVERLDMIGEFAEPFDPIRVGAADQQSRAKAVSDQSDPIEAVRERPFRKERFGAKSECAVAAQRARFHVE